jgi:hypothetical protein
MSAEELEPIFDNLADLRLQDVADHIKSLIAEYAVYTGKLNENEEAIKGQARALLQATAAEELSEEKYANQLVDIFANKAALDASSGSRASRVEDFAKKETALNNEDFKALAEEYDVDLSSKDHVGNLERLYAAMKGTDVESIEEELKGNVKALAAAIVDMEAGSKLIKSLEDFTIEIAGIDDGLKKGLLGLLAGDASLFDLGEIGENFVKNLVDGLGENIGSIAEFLGMTGDELIATLKNNAEQILARQTQAIKGLSDKGIDESSLKGFSIEILERLSKQVADMGEEAAQDYVAAWIGVVSDSDLGAKQKEELENTLSDIDWSNMSDAISGMKAMTDMGMDPAKIREFWDVATSGAKTHVESVKEATTIVDNFHKKSIETSEAIDRLLEGKGTAEDLELLRQANLDFTGSLVQTADGWQLVGSSAKEATDALKGII